MGIVSGLPVEPVRALSIYLQSPSLLCTIPSPAISPLASFPSQPCVTTLSVALSVTTLSQAICGAPVPPQDPASPVQW